MILWYLLAAIGCQNDCQRLCEEMQVFAEECNYKFTEQMMNECMDNQAEKESDEDCSKALLKLEERSEWECNDLDVFFDDPAAEESPAEE